MHAVRLRHPIVDLDVVASVRATDAERGAALPQREASFRVRGWFAGAVDARVLAQLYALAFAHTITEPRGADAPGVLLRRVEEAVELGRLLVIARPRRQVVVPLQNDDVVLGPVDEPTSWIEIELIDDAGAPLPEEPYTIVTGDGRIRSGVLDWRGRAREEGIDAGDCKVTFRRLHGWRAA